MDINEIWAEENIFFRDFDSCSLARGGLTLNDIHELKQLLEPYKKPNMKIADVGCWTGLSTVVLSGIIEPSTVYAIDWFQGSEYTNLTFSGKFFKIRAILEENLKHFKRHNVEIIDCLSYDAADKFENNSLDVVFLDADHRYSNIKNDMKKWLPKVAHGGILCGHDCEMIINSLEDIHSMFVDKDIISVLHYGVCKAVGELGGTKFISTHKHTKEESLASSLWYFHKI